MYLFLYSWNTNQLFYAGYDSNDYIAVKGNIKPSSTDILPHAGR